MRVARGGVGLGSPAGWAGSFSSSPLFPRPLGPPAPPPHTRLEASCSAQLRCLPRINGHPGKSLRLAGLWKLEEVSLSWVPCRPAPKLPLLGLTAIPACPQCHLSGCMMDLFVQMAVIMGLKQTLSNCMEYLGP